MHTDRGPFHYAHVPEHLRRGPIRSWHSLRQRENEPMAPDNSRCQAAVAVRSRRQFKQCTGVAYRSPFCYSHWKFGWEHFRSVLDLVHKWMRLPRKRKAIPTPSMPPEPPVATAEISLRKAIPDSAATSWHENRGLGRASYPAAFVVGRPRNPCPVAFSSNILAAVSDALGHEAADRLNPKLYEEHTQFPLPRMGGWIHFDQKRGGRRACAQLQGRRQAGI